MQSFDVIIIGAGHNGLVSAGYLLKAEYSVLLLEKRSLPGGAATTEEALPAQVNCRYSRQLWPEQLAGFIVSVGGR